MDEEVWKQRLQKSMMALNSWQGEAAEADTDVTVENDATNS